MKHINLRFSSFLNFFLSARTAGMMVCVSVLGLTGPSSFAADEPREMPAYREMIRGDQYREKGQTRRALRQYRNAMDLFERLQRDYPDYKPATMDYRSDYCREQIHRLDATPEETAGTNGPASPLAAAQAEAERWKAETERLSVRLLDLEMALQDSQVHEYEERIRDLEEKLTTARKTIRRLNQAGPPSPPFSEKAQAGSASPEPSTREQRARQTPSTPASLPDDSLQEAQEALAHGDSVLARKLFQSILDQDPRTKRSGFWPGRRRITGGNPAARFGLAQACAQCGNLQRAKRLAHDLSREYPQKAAYAHLEGSLAREKGRHAEAATHFSRAVQLDPSSPAYLFDLATSLHSNGQYDQAIKQYRALLALEGEHRLAHYNLAALLIGEGPEYLEAARNHYEKAISLGEPPDATFERLLEARQGERSP